MATRRFAPEWLPTFEMLEPRLLLSTGTALTGSLVDVKDTQAVAAVVTPLSLSPDPTPVSASSRSWTWSGSMAIPDGPSGAWVGINCLTPGSIPSGASVTQVSVHYEITHPYVGDLQLQVYDSAHTWAVRTNEGGSSHNLNETRIDYSTFVGDAPQQDWFFRVRDTYAADIGTLTAMQLIVTYADSPDTPPQISGIPNVTIDENTTFPSAGGSAAAPAAVPNAADRLGFDGDTSKFDVGAAGSPLADATPTGTSFMLTDHFGGTWWDAEKTLSNTQDDLMCWAAAASNMLEWTGWGNVNGMTTSTQIFHYFQDHWTDDGGMMRYGWEWWFSGTNPSAGWYGWSQVDVPGGGFYPTQSFNSYFHDQETDSQAMAAIDQFTRAGYGTTIGIFGPGGHAITVWGFNYNPANPTQYYGIWVTDSDDDKNTDTPTPQLRYYNVALTGGQWHLQNYYGTNDWYIGAVQGLDRNPGGTPTPQPNPSDVDLWNYASDAETPVDQLAFSIIGNSNPSVGVSIDSNRYIHVNPAHNWYGSSTVTVAVSDGVMVATDSFLITVNHVNQPPTISGLPDRALFKNGSLPYTIYLPSYASDPETPSASLSYSIVGNTYPSCGASLVSGAYISINPTSNWTGSSDVTVQVSDGQATATDTFHVTVSNAYADLTGALTPIILPTPTRAADYHLVQLAVTNSGNATASSFATMELWASADGTIDSDGNDFKLGEIRPYVYLPGGATGYYYFSYVAPSNIPAGTYSLVSLVDSHNDIAETGAGGETNNQTTILNRVVMQNPDLTVAFQFVSVPAAPNKGAWAYTLLRVTNSGSGMAYGPQDIQIWATSDGNIHDGTGDTLLTTLNNYWVVLPAGASTYFGAVFQIPASLASGSYKLDAVVDATNKILETNESNNESLTGSFYPVGVTAGLRLEEVRLGVQKEIPSRAPAVPLAPSVKPQIGSSSLAVPQVSSLKPQAGFYSLAVPQVSLPQASSLSSSLLSVAHSATSRHSSGVNAAALWDWRRWDLVLPS